MMIYKPSKLIYSSVHIDRVYHFIQDHFTRIRKSFLTDPEVTLPIYETYLIYLRIYIKIHIINTYVDM